MTQSRNERVSLNTIRILRATSAIPAVTCVPITASLVAESECTRFVTHVKSLSASPSNRMTSESIESERVNLAELYDFMRKVYKRTR